MLMQTEEVDRMVEVLCEALAFHQVDPLVVLEDDVWVEVCSLEVFLACLWERPEDQSQGVVDGNP